MRRLKYLKKNSALTKSTPNLDTEWRSTEEGYSNASNRENSQTFYNPKSNGSFTGDLMGSSVSNDDDMSYLDGDVSLEIELPDGRMVNMTVDAKTAMIDLLMMVTTRNGMKPGGLMLKVPSDRPPGYLSYKPSTPIGKLPSTSIQVVHRSDIIEAPKKLLPKTANQPFELTFRIQVDLPRGQKTFLRVNPKQELRHILLDVCHQYNLSSEEYCLRVAETPSIPLDVTRPVGSVPSQNFVVQAVSAYDWRKSTGDLFGYIAKMPIEEKERTKSKGLFGLFSKKKKMSSKKLSAPSIPPDHSPGRLSRPLSVQDYGSSTGTQADSIVTASALSPGASTVSSDGIVASDNMVILRQQQSQKERPVTMPPKSTNRSESAQAPGHHKKKRHAPPPPVEQGFVSSKSVPDQTPLQVQAAQNGQVLKRQNSVDRHSDSSGYHDYSTMSHSPSSGAGTSSTGGEYSSLEKDSNKKNNANSKSKKAPPAPDAYKDPVAKSLIKVSQNGKVVDVNSDSDHKHPDDLSGCSDEDVQTGFQEVIDEAIRQNAVETNKKGILVEPPSELEPDLPEILDPEKQFAEVAPTSLPVNRSALFDQILPKEQAQKIEIEPESKHDFGSTTITKTTIKSESIVTTADDKTDKTVLPCASRPTNLDDVIKNEAVESGKQDSESEPEIHKEPLVDQTKPEEPIVLLEEVTIEEIAEIMNHQKIKITSDSDSDPDLGLRAPAIPPPVPPPFYPLEDKGGPTEDLPRTPPPSPQAEKIEESPEQPTKLKKTKSIETNQKLVDPADIITVSVARSSGNRQQNIKRNYETNDSKQEGDSKLVGKDESLQRNEKTTFQQQNVPKQKTSMSRMVVVEEQSKLPVRSFEDEYYKKSHEDDYLRLARHGTLEKSVEPISIPFDRTPSPGHDPSRSAKSYKAVQKVSLDAGVGKVSEGQSADKTKTTVEDQLQTEYENLSNMFNEWQARMKEHQDIIAQGGTVAEPRMRAFQRLQTRMVQQHQQVQYLCQEVEQQTKGDSGDKPPKSLASPSSLVEDQKLLNKRSSVSSSGTSASSSMSPTSSVTSSAPFSRTPSPPKAPASYALSTKSTTTKFASTPENEHRRSSYKETGYKPTVDVVRLSRNPSGGGDDDFETVSRPYQRTSLKIDTYDPSTSPVQQQNSKAKAPIQQTSPQQQSPPEVKHVAQYTNNNNSRKGVSFSQDSQDTEEYGVDRSGIVKPSMIFGAKLNQAERNYGGGVTNRASWVKDTTTAPAPAAAYKPMVSPSVVKSTGAFAGSTGSNTGQYHQTTTVTLTGNSNKPWSIPKADRYPAKPIASSAALPAAPLEQQQKQRQFTSFADQPSMLGAGTFEQREQKMKPEPVTEIPPKDPDTGRKPAISNNIPAVPIPPPPPPPGPAPILAEMAKVQLRPSCERGAKQTARKPVSSQDPRDELMNAIRDFGGANRLKKVSMSNTRFTT